LPSGATAIERVGSGTLTLIAAETGLPFWSTTTVDGRWPAPIALSPDCRLAAAGMGAYERTSIGIFDGKTGTLLRTIKGTDPSQGVFRQAAFSPDGNRVAVSQRDGTVLIWDLASLGLK
jgi:WD40 repeat protein